MRRVSVESASRLTTSPAWMTDRSGHDEFAEFYRAELPALVALARGLCGAAAAEDVAQEAMLVVYRRWSEVHALGQPHLWARRTCANLAVSAFRRRMVELRGVSRLAPRFEPEPLDPPSDEFWAAVRSLPGRQAQCAALRYVYEMSGAEIAVTLGISEGSVKVHLARARGRLARQLGLEREDGS